jgi:branched-chain amino acid transport system substrate-binding protein
VRVARQFVTDPNVVAVIGHLNSGATLASAPIYAQGNDPLVAISPSASSPDISRAGAFTFRVCPDDLVHGERLAEWARDQLGARTAAIVYRNNAYGRGVRSTFREGFTARGGRIVSVDPYSAALPSFEPYLTRLRIRGGADVLMIAGSRPGAEQVLAALDSAGLRPVVLAGDGVAGIEAAGAAAEGLLISLAYLPDRPSEANQNFVAAYRDAYDSNPDHRGAGAYDVVHLLARAIQEVGTDRRRIRNYVAGIGRDTAPFQGVTGEIAFDENGDAAGKEVVIGVVRNGRIVSARAR